MWGKLEQILISEIALDPTIVYNITAYSPETVERIPR